MPLGGFIQGLFGSDKAPMAVLNRYAQPAAVASGRLATRTLRDIQPDLANAFNTYMAGQARQEGLAGEQADVLRTLLGRRLADDPSRNLENIFRIAFSQIDPNVLAPLAAGDVSRNRLDRMAAGINTGAIDSTAERLRNARIASGRYYDVARNVYNAVPQLFNSAYSQGAANDAAAAGFIPGISAAYESVASRPTTGILNRINAARSGVGLGSDAINAITAATQGYKTPKNFWDRLGGVLKEDEATVMQLAQMALSAYTGGLAGGGGGGGLGGIMSMFGGGGGAAAGGRPMQSIQTPTPYYPVG